MQTKLVMFDLDDTLAVSKSDLAPDMAACLHALLEARFVSVISGCKWEQFAEKVVKFIDPRHYARLIVAPVSGGQVYRFRSGAWQLVNSTSLGLTFDQIVAAFEQAFTATGFVRPTRLWGEEFEDRISQVTYSALGQEAPAAEKKAWDPDHAKRRPVIEELRRLLPPYLAVRTGGTTSIDVSGFEKDYGIRQVVLQMMHEGITEDDVLFVGDAIFPGGNDYAVTRTNVRWVPTQSLADTRRIITELVANEAAVLATARRGPTR